MATNRYTGKAEPIAQTVTVQVTAYDAATTYTLTVGGAKARGFLTLTGLPLDTETTVIGGKTYTWQDTLTDVDGNVHIGATASDCIDNLIAAIILGSGSGTKYAATMTLHTTATAETWIGDLMRVSAKQPGTAGNALATTETLANGSWNAATMLLGLEGQVTISAVGITDINTTATAIATAWNASDHPYFSQVTAVAVTDTITLTADALGAPFDVSSSVSGGAGTLTDPTTTVANSGPNEVSSVNNWSLGALPVATDDVVIDLAIADIAWGLESFETELLGSLLIVLATKRIGLDRNSFATGAAARSATAGYKEYRPLYLKVQVNSSGKVTIRRADGSTASTASGRILLDLQDQQSDVEILEGPTSAADNGKPAIRILNNHASSQIFADGVTGGFGIAVDDGSETSLLKFLTVGDDPNNKVFTGSGVTWGAGNVVFLKDGVSVIRSGGDIAELEKNAGTLTTEGDFAITLFKTWSGQNWMRNSKTGADEVVTAELNGGNTNTVKPSKDKQWTTTKLYGGELTYDPRFFKSTSTLLNETAGGVPPITTKVGGG